MLRIYQLKRTLQARNSDQTHNHIENLDYAVT
jgi:hypothetical protein